MAKYESINMDPSLIRKSSRKAPKLTQAELKSKIDAYFARKYGDDDIESILAEGIDDNLSSDIYPCYMENLSTLDSHYGYQTLKNGFSFYGMYGGPDGGGSVYFILYWDGKKVRGYVPRYGNTVNIDCKGFESMYGEYWDVEEIHYKKWFKSPNVQALTEENRKAINHNWNIMNSESFKKGHIDVLPLMGPIDFKDFKQLGANVAYRIAHGYPELAEDDINFDAVYEDILNRITVY